MGILSRAEKRLIECHLRRYEVYKNMVDDYFASVEESGRDETVGGVSNIPGKPTERAALNTLEPPAQIRDAMRWIQVHQMTRDRLSPEKREFMERVFYREQSIVGVMVGMRIEEAAYYRWKDEVFTAFAMLAAVKGMLELKTETMIVFTGNSVV